MKNYKTFAIVNLINIVLLGLVVVLYFVIPLQYVVVIGVFWLVYSIYSNYALLSKTCVTSLREADTRHLFRSEIDALESAYKSLEIKRDYFEGYPEGDSIREAFDLIATQVEANINSATSYIAHYDYILAPSTKYLTNLCINTRQLIIKLNELNDMVIQIDNSAGDVDTTFVDDMIKSLREMSKDEEAE